MVNQCLEKGDSASIVTILQSPNFDLKAVPECAEIYYEHLQEAKNLKTKGIVVCAILHSIGNV